MITIRDLGGSNQFAMLLIFLACWLPDTSSFTLYVWSRKNLSSAWSKGKHIWCVKVLRGPKFRNWCSDYEEIGGNRPWISQLLVQFFLAYLYRYWITWTKFPWTLAWFIRENQSSRLENIPLQLFDKRLRKCILGEQKVARGSVYMELKESK